MPTVSVIMGVYNCKRFDLLDKSIESIVGQTYTDWEFLICDDGSTDKTTYAHLKEFANKDSRIHVIGYSQNSGLSFALNTCLREVKGRYIVRQDDDDVSLPDRLHKLVDFAEENPQYAIIGSKAYVTDDNGIWGDFPVEETPDKKSFYWNSPFIHPTTLIRREALESVGGYRVAKETRRCEDYDLFMRMYAAGYKGFNIQEPLYEYRLINGKQKNRPMWQRIDEAVVRWKGFSQLGILLLGGLYVVKPLVIGIIPQMVLKRIKKKQYSKE